jgi:hypothetical protein
MPKKVVDYYKDRIMEKRNDDRHSEDSHRSGEPANGQQEGSGKIATASKAIRAITAIVVFGVPLVTGTATLLGYGVYKAYKRLTKRS